MSLSIKPEFGYVCGVVAASALVHHVYMSFKVGQARKLYKVEYPALYADKDNCPDEVKRNRFNCIQRGHQNSLENQPIFLALLICAGFKHPITAATAGLVYLAGRIAYFNGYSTGKPKGRLLGSFSYFGLFTLLGVCIKVGVQTFNC